jgi:signal transduction histidine kinase
MRAWLSNASLQARIGTFVAAILFSVAVFLVVSLGAVFRAQGRAALEARARGIAEVVADAAAPAVDFDDARAAAELLRAVATGKDVLYCAIHRPDGSLLAGWNEQRAGAPSVKETSRETELRVAAPIVSRGGDAATLTMGFSLSQLHAAEREALTRAVAIAAAAFLIGLVLAIALARVLARPIEQMTEVADRITRGEEEARRALPLERRDEVGRMAFAFDRMLAHLRDERAALAARGEELQHSIQQLKEAQEQLLQAGKMAAIGSVVAGLSHELNNPLGIILGNVQGLLRRAPDDHPERQALAAIERQSQRCRGLVRTLLDFSRKPHGERQRIDAAALVDRVVALSATLARDRGIVLEAVPAPDCAVFVATQEIESALLNLVSNALDATAAGGKVTIDVRAVDPAASAIEFSVVDSGAGIPPELLARVFDPFYTTKPPGQGTGIGLPLARRFVEQHGGKLVLESSPGRGTAARFWLPTASLPSRSAQA